MDANHGSIAQNQAQRLFKEEMAFQQSKPYSNTFYQDETSSI